MARLHLDGMLREFVRARQVEAAAASVGGAIEELESRFPRLRGKIRDETGNVRRFVRVYVNGTDIAALRGLDTPVGREDRVDILHSIAGG